MKTVFQFPGQGAQKEGMLRMIEADQPFVKEILEQAAEILKEPVEGLDTAAKLSSSAYVQVAIFIAGIISAKRLMAENVEPDFVAGHSIGAFTASVISGALSFEQALPVVFARGQLMQRAYPTGYGMVALVGLSELTVKKYINAFNLTNNRKIYLANVNTADQMVVAGAVDSIISFTGSIQTTLLRKVKLLNMSVPSHCELLQGVSDVLKGMLGTLVLREPSIPYLSNYNGRVLKSSDDIRTDLWKSVAHTVRWYDGTSLLYELGARVFIELYPSGVLSKMTESSFPDAKVLAVQQGKEESIKWLWEHYQEQNV